MVADLLHAVRDALVRGPTGNAEPSPLHDQCCGRDGIVTWNYEGVAEGGEVVVGVRCQWKDGILQALQLD